MAGHSDVKLKKFAVALALGQSAVEASHTAGYPRGISEKTYAANARKRAIRKDVKDMVAELQKPALDKVKQTIEANINWATETLLEVANLDNGLWKLKHTAADKIRAVEALAKLHGWNAPEKTENKVTVERIELVFVDPPTRRSDSL